VNRSTDNGLVFPGSPRLNVAIPSQVQRSIGAGGQTKSNAQFLAKPSVKLAKSIMSRIDRLSPRLAARLTYRLISSPPRHRPHDSELMLRAAAKQWRVPFQGGWLQCYRWGQGPVCLYVHCWGGRGTQAQDMIRDLVQNGMSVVSFDHPAHGRSSGTRAEMIRMSAAVAAVAHEVGEVATLIGHSLGVVAAAIALRDYDLAVNRLVSISSLTHCTWFTEVIGGYLGISKTTLSLARSFLDSQYTQAINWDELSVVRILPTLGLPVLLVHDHDDQEIPFAHAQAIHQATPDAELLETQGLGHRRLLKDPDVLRRVVRFAQQEVA
jgi:pimeloyl-ACP methyl ester carboxylesterase